MSIRKQISAGLATLGVSGVAMLLTALPAAAVLTHPFTGHSFGPTGIGSGAFSYPLGVAVDQSSGDVYVYDSAVESVYKFDASGEPLNYTGLAGNVITHAGFSYSGGETELAVDSSSAATHGDIYVASPYATALLVYAPSGVKIAELSASGPCGVAVDASGNVYLALAGGVVKRYTPASNPVSAADYSSSLSGIGSSCSIAVDSAGDLYAASPSGSVTKYEASQFNTEGIAAVGKPVGGAGGTVAVDAAAGSDDLYVDQGSALVQYDSSGATLGSSGTAGAGALSGSYGVAIDHASGEVYAANSNGLVNIYGAAIVVADTNSEAASNITKTTAMLNGSINPDGTSVSACEFEYGTEAGSYPETVPCAQAMPQSGEHAVPVSAALSGLSANTVYHYRLSATNANGVSQGQDQSFTTPQAVDSLSTGLASNVTGTAAKLTGSLSPDGSDTHYYFEYGTEESYGSISPALPGTDAGSGSVRVAAETTLGGLQVGSTYHYRLVGANSFGTTYGGDETLTTRAAVSGVRTSAATGIAGTGATLAGSLEPNGSDTHYYFEYGTEESYGSSTPLQDAGSASEARSVSAVVGGLQPNEIYHYRLVGENGLGKSYGADRTLRTLLLGPVLGGAGSAVSITRSNAVLGFTVNSENNSTTYWLEYGPSAAYGATTAKVALAAGAAAEAVEVNLEDLAAGTLYHYRLVASNSGGTAAGPDETFTTSAPSPPVVTTGAAGAVGQNTATITGSVSSQGQATSYGFEIGSGAGYGEPMGRGTLSVGEEGIALALNGLQPGTTYHYRVEASNLDGTTYGPDQTFTTAGVASALTVPSAPPLIVTPAVAFPSAKAPAAKVKATKPKTKKKPRKSTRKKPRAKHKGARKK
jgi:hypothetical protein